MTDSTDIPAIVERVREDDKLRTDISIRMDANFAALTRNALAAPVLADEVERLRAELANAYIRLGNYANEVSHLRQVIDEARDQSSERCHLCTWKRPLPDGEWELVQQCNLHAAIARLRGVLAKLEWKGYGWRIGGEFVEGICPVCINKKPTHHENCQLAAVLVGESGLLAKPTDAIGGELVMGPPPEKDDIAKTNQIVKQILRIAEQWAAGEKNAAAAISQVLAETQAALAGEGGE